MAKCAINLNSSTLQRCKNTPKFVAGCTFVRTCKSDPAARGRGIRVATPRINMHYMYIYYIWVL